jgi:hypothetical protein
MTRKAQRLATTATVAVAITLAITIGARAAPQRPEVDPATPASHAVSSDALARPTIIRTAAAGNGFDWDDAAIGAGFGFALSMCGLGAALTVSHHCAHRRKGVPTSGPTRA